VKRDDLSREKPVPMDVAGEWDQQWLWYSSSMTGFLGEVSSHISQKLF
jgi:hypothetical protein